MGRTDEAIASLRELVAMAEPVLAATDPLRSSLLAALAYALGRRGQQAAALPLRLCVVELDEARLGPDHLEVATDDSALGTTELATGELAAGLASMQRALASREAALPPSDLALADAHDDLALALLAQAREEEAIARHACARDPSCGRRRCVTDDQLGCDPPPLRQQCRLRSCGEHSPAAFIDGSRYVGDWTVIERRKLVKASEQPDAKPATKPSPAARPKAGG